MKIPNQVAHDIDATVYETPYDAACKKLLSHKVFLASIMKNTMKEVQGLTLQEIMDQCLTEPPDIGTRPIHQDEKTSKIEGIGTEKTSQREGTVKFDIHFIARLPKNGERVKVYVNIEAQKDYRPTPGYPLVKRGIYNCSRMISAQYGTEFTRQNYGQIKKVFSIWLCVNVPKHLTNTISQYAIQESHLHGTATELPENYDLLTVIMIHLGNPDTETSSDLIGMLKVLLSDKMSSEEKKSKLQNQYEIPMSYEIESEVKEMCNLSQLIVERTREETRQEEREIGIKALIEFAVKTGTSKEVTQENQRQVFSSPF